MAKATKTTRLGAKKAAKRLEAGASTDLSNSKKDRPQADPDKAKLSKLQAMRLADLTGLAAKDLAGRRIGEIHKELQWRLDPHLLLFRRVCGQVVRRNPETGELEGVPNATVEVEDTDCNFMIYSPPGWPNWSWFFPFKCKREIIATVQTDQCGHFCVWIPAWEIDWIIRWRRARICFPTLYRPRLKDFLEPILIPELVREPPVVRPPRPPVTALGNRMSVAATPIEIPRPKPDPHELRRQQIARLGSTLRRPDMVGRVTEAGGPAVAVQLEALAERSSFGAITDRLGAELETPSIPMPPPLPEGDTKKILRREIDADLTDDLRREVRELDFSRWTGPFRRCIDVVLGIWTPVFDVPDITFRVTQDTDGDGVDEVIYSEGFFDVRWNSDPLSNLVLEADASAISSPTCEGPEIDPSDCSAPTILTAGLMALQAPHFDTTTGYATMVNMARSGGTSGSARDTATQSPLWRTVQLHGCHRFPGAVHYRLMQRHETSSTFTPVLGETWHAPRLGSGPPFLIAPDSDGWYPILPEGALVFPHWLLNWRTWRYAKGKYDMKLQLGDGAKSVIDESADVPLQVDNTRPHGAFTAVQWRHAGDTSWTLLPHACPVIRRTAGVDVEVQVSCEVSATHYRNAHLFGISCGGTALSELSLPEQYDNWHTVPADNSWTTTAIFGISHTLPDGAYTIGLNVNGRAFNPAGGDAGPSSGWNYDEVYSWIHPRRHIAVVDA